MPIKRGLENGKYYYQYGESGKKYFYITGNKTSRDKAKLKAIKQMQAIKVNQIGGAAFRFNTQTPEKMAKIQEKYKGQAHPDFINQYADILDGHVKMMGWRSGRSSEWYPEEHAAYLRDGSPISTTEVINMAGKTWNNMDELNRIRRGKGVKPAGRSRNLGYFKLNGQNG